MPNQEVSFFAIRNLKSADAARLPNPWEYDSSAAPWDWPKDKWDAEWLNSGIADHCLIKLCEGAIPGAKIGADNPVCAIHGFIADYDGMTPDGVENIVAATKSRKVPSGHLPAYVVHTKSEKARLVWLFQHPLRVTGDDHAKRMMMYVAAQVRAKMWFAGYDDKASENPGQYLCIGRKWLPSSPKARISSDIVQMWDAEVFKKKLEWERVRNKSADIPMSECKAEAQSRGWAKTPADFREGGHCCRFWDPSSDNERGCLITKAGVRVYVPHDKPFMSWADIFGKAFTDRFESVGFSHISQDIHFDRGKGEYWMRDDSDVYVKQTSSDMLREFKAAGFSASVPKGATISPAEELLLKCKRQSGVDAVVKYLYQPQGARPLPDGTKVLNVSRIKVVEPSAPLADANADWNSVYVREAFPFLWGLIDHLFGGKGGTPDGDPVTQIQRFLWWMAAFYQASYNMVPRNGQALFLAGNASMGKSFIAKHVIPPLMGGATTDAAAHLMGDTRFTSDLAGQPVLNIDDDSSGVNPKIHELFTLKLKKYVANGELPWHKKGGIETTIPWYGRIVVTCNTDRRSLKIIPDLGHSNCDKVTVLLVTARTQYSGFGSFPYNLMMVQRELPVFARYLLDLEIPEAYRSGRYGVASWQHPVLMTASKTTDSASTVLEALNEMFCGLEKSVDKDTGVRKVWSGTASKLHSHLSQVVPSFARDCPNAQRLGLELSRMRDRGFDISSRTQDEDLILIWDIPYDIAHRGADKDRAQAAQEELIK